MRIALLAVVVLLSAACTTVEPPSDELHRLCKEYDGVVIRDNDKFVCVVDDEPVQLPEA